MARARGFSLSGDVSSALEETVKRLEAEESATQTRAERAAEAATSPQPEQPAAVDAKAVIAQVLALPAEKLTPMLVVGLDLSVRRLAEWRGGEEAREKYALRPDERELLAQVWTPIVAHYMSQVDVHPLVAAVGVTGFVYVTKALPEGGLEAVLGGNGSAPVPRAEVPRSPAELLRPPPTSTPQTDPVLELARQQAEARKREREQEAQA